MRSTLRTAALLVCLCAALPLAAQDTTAPSPTEDPAMTRAIGQARAQLDLVLSRVMTGDRDIHPALNFKVEIPVTHFDVAHEIIWVDRLSLSEDGTFAGHLANEPAYMPGHSLGDAVTFSRDQIADWSVMNTDGRMYGHFTTRVLIRDLPEAEAAPLRDLLSVDPIPDAWR
ncbi:YegJ family protein [Sagittula sp. S175]|uniref:YegJ family protein n=1 Tax=Sagittula sp. S175 TaxID=3415129 RepID=UPI003C79D96C